MDYKYAKDIADTLKEEVSGLIITGSIKRKAKIVNDIDILTFKNLPPILDKIQELYPNNMVLKNGDKHISIKVEIDDEEVQIDVWKALNRYELFYKKFNRDMERGRNIGYKKMAKNKGYLLSETGLYDENSNLINITNAKELEMFLKS